MPSLVIVAIPEQTDEVWKISSEQKPHMTLLYLGEADQVENSESIVQFVEHASTLMAPFWMEMDYRGVLGADEADVIFFEKGWDFKQIETFRNQLLKNKAIRAAYNSAEQYDEWTPHLTLGYPETPAKETDRSLFSVRFDRIGVWMGDYEGSEFRLKHENITYDEASVSMSAEDAKALLHYGIKGMRWGVRSASASGGDKATSPTPGGIKGRVAAAKAANQKARAEAVAPKPISVKTGLTPKGKTSIKTEGGKNQPAHPDAIAAAVKKQQLHTSGLHSLSNKELQELATRLNLEQQINRLEPQKLTLGQKFAKRAMADPVKTQKELDQAITTGQKYVKLAKTKKAATTAVKVAAVAAA